MKKKQLLILTGLIIITAWGAAGEAEQTSIEPAAETKQKLLPEGFQIADRRAKLLRHSKDNRWFLVFETFERADSQQREKAGTADKSKLTPNGKFGCQMEVLPGKWLTAMTRVNKDGNLTFRVWGEVTVYQNRNFVLPTLVTTESLFGKKTSVKTNGDGPNGVSANKTKRTSNEHKDNGTSKAHEEKELARLRELLLKVPRTRILEITEKIDGAGKGTNVQEGLKAKAGPETNKSKGKKIASSQAKWKEGQLVWDRVGRLLYDGQDCQVLFAFEADGATLGEPPVIVQPNRLLEVMENTERKSSHPLKFRVSGVVSKYQGKNYLLLRKAFIETRRGNLGK